MLRIDCFLTLYFFKHLAKFYPRAKDIRIPILMYHSISDEPEKGHPYFWINTSPKLFAEQMKFLHDNDYKVISLSEAVDIIKYNTQHSTLNTVVVTFDDGYHDFFTHAFPVLRRYGFTATVFLPTGFIDGVKVGLKGKNHLSWEEVRRLQDEGIAFGSHTVNHPQLVDLGRDGIEYEIKKSKETIERKTKQKVDSFSYPYKFPDGNRTHASMLYGILEDSGYKNGVSTRIGTINCKDDAFWLKRIPMNSCDDILFFRAKLKGEYDWVYGAQHINKIAHRIISKNSKS